MTEGTDDQTTGRRGIARFLPGLIPLAIFLEIIVVANQGKTGY